MSNKQALPGKVTADLLEGFDWKNTALGSRDTWSDALNMAVNLCLSRREPSLVAWGNDLVQIYNDAYASLIGIRHPASFGESGRKSWALQWHEVGPILEQLLKDGKSFYIENQLFNVTRKGFPEQCYYTCSYEPLISAKGVAGIFVTVTETTDDVLHQKMVTENEERLNMAIKSTGLGTWEYNSTTKAFTASEECRNIFGIAEPDKANYTVFNSCVHPDDLAHMQEQMAQSRKALGGGMFETTHRIITKDKKSVRWIRSWGRIFFGNDQQPEKYIGTVVDITEQKLLEETLRRNESRARLGIEASGLGTFEYDLTTKNFQYSQRLAQIFGYLDDDRITYETFGSGIHADDQPVRVAALERLAKTGVLFYEARVVWPDKAVHWVRINGVMLDDHDGKATQLYGTAFDITESKMKSEALDEELRESEERYHRMIDEVEDYAIILLNPDGIIMNWNAGAEKIKQYTEAEAVGNHFSIFYLPDDQANRLPDRLIAQAKSTGKAAHEGWRVRKDGSRFWGSILITLLHDSSGKNIGFSKVTRDLTERKSAEDKLITYTSELEARNKELEQFAFVASHDLQEPLRKIQTFTDLIQSNMHDEVMVNRYFDKINIAAQRMRDLIRATLNYSSLSKEGINQVDVNLDEVLAEVRADMELLIQVKKVMIRSRKLPVVKGNAIQIGQVFANLIGNAIKFSDKEPVIEISCNIVSRSEIDQAPKLTAAEYYEIVISDNGIGFEPQYAQRIFAIFQRLHGKKEFEGTGIGLALCRKIMENHQGYITATGDPGKGSKFYLYFPVNQPA